MKKATPLRPYQLTARFTFYQVSALCCQTKILTYLGEDFLQQTLDLITKRSE